MSLSHARASDIDPAGVSYASLSSSSSSSSSPCSLHQIQNKDSQISTSLSIIISIAASDLQCNKKKQVFRLRNVDRRSCNFGLIDYRIVDIFLLVDLRNL